MKSVIIVGAGIVGMMTAIRLKAQGLDVRLIEKNAETSSELGLTIQSNHLHVLLQAGMESCLEAIPELVPFFQTLPEIDWSQDTLWENRFGSFPRGPSGVKTRGISRRKLESKIQEAVAQRKIPIIFDVAVELIQNSSGRVEGVKTRSGQIHTADAIVVSSGAGVSTLLSKIRRQSYHLGLTYRSVVLGNLPARTFLQYYYQLDPTRERFGGVVTPIEDQTWIATLMSYENPNPDRLQRGTVPFPEFKSLCREVPGKFAELVGEATPVSNVFELRRDTTHLLDSNDLRRLPGGVYVIGDALASLNPAFGQGMTVGLKQIDELVTALGSLNPRQAARAQRTFHLRALKIAADALHLSQFASGQKGALASRAYEYLLKRILREPNLHQEFLKVLHFKSPLKSLVKLALKTTVSFRKNQQQRIDRVWVD
jgi:2-polyprenyl-6-methoxyphenol hydroxylase-like FAD-dependent oxidoreductase